MQRITKLGYNADVDAGTEDIVPQGGTQHFPAAAAATSIDCSSANDTAGGSGARTVLVEGVDAVGKYISEIVTLDGTSSDVLCVNQYYRVNKITVLTAGNGGVAAGTIDAIHVGGILCRVEAGQNVSRSSFHCVDARQKIWSIRALYLHIAGNVAGTLRFTVRTRKLGDLWNERWSLTLHGQNYPAHVVKLHNEIFLEPGEDIIITGLSDAANIIAHANYDLVGSNSIASRSA